MKDNHPNIHAVAFTGHRKLEGKYPPSPKWEAVSQAVRELALSFVATGYDITHFCSGGALGFDQVAASAVIKLREQGFPVTLTFALPFPGFEVRWPEKSQANLKSLCRQANKVVFVDNEPRYFPWKMQKRNEYMIDRAQSVIALMYPAVKKGGTLNAVKYAEKKNRDILIINPTQEPIISAER